MAVTTVRSFHVFTQQNVLPEYLLITLSLAKPSVGNIVIDELLSVLLPLFLGNKVNSSVVLQKALRDQQEPLHQRNL